MGQSVDIVMHNMFEKTFYDLEVLNVGYFLFSNSYQIELKINYDELLF